MINRKQYHSILLGILLLIPSLAMAKMNNTGSANFSGVDFPLYFEKNQGQFDQHYGFIAHNRNSFFAFANQSILINVSHQNNSSTQMGLTFPGSQPATLSGKNKQTNTVNYLRGKNSQWVTGVNTFAAVEYGSLYPGVDVLFYFNPHKLEYDFIVHPGSDPDQIVMAFPAADSIELNAQGDLLVKKNQQAFLQRAPVIYQEIGGKRQFVSGVYKVNGKEVAFVLGDYDKSYQLVIDPVIDFSSYFGGDWEDQANVVREDSAGNIWVAGSTAAKARITVKNLMTLEHTAADVSDDANADNYFQAQHGILLDESFKFDETTQSGAYADLEKDLKVNVTNGVEQSEEFQYNCDYEYQGLFNRDRLVTDYDGFVAKFTSDMQPIFVTYLGGCRNDGIRALEIDNNDAVYVAGFSLSDDLPTKSASQFLLAESRFITEPVQSDAFYAKFDNDGALAYLSYLGGNGRDGARDITVDNDGFLYITGYTHSTNLKTEPCSDLTVQALNCDYIGEINETNDNAETIEESIYADAFVAKVSPNGDALVFLTYLGGRYDDWGQSIVIQDDGVLVAGNSASPNLPSVNGFYSFMAYNENIPLDSTTQTTEPCSRIREVESLSFRQADAHECEDVFLAKLSLDGTELKFLTYLGGAKDDNVSDMQVDSNGNIYLFGTTHSQGARLVDGEIGTGEVDPVLAVRFPLYKNLNQYAFDVNSVSTMAFLSIFNPQADKLLLSSYIGGSDDDAGIALDIKETGFNGNELQSIDLFLGGHTVSRDFFTMNAFQHVSAESDVFVIKLQLDLTQVDEPYTLDNNSGTCNINECSLYAIAYSTLFGGEDLDSLKDLAFVASRNSLMIAGSTFSTKFPVSDSNLKASINAVTEIEYDPVDRSIDDQFQYFPSDGFVTSFNDSGDVTDISLSLTIPNEKGIKEDDVLQYDLLVKNVSEIRNENGDILKEGVIAENVSLQVQFPYLSSLQRINNLVSINVDDCVLRIRLLLCQLGDLAVEEQKSLNLKIQPTVDGRFAVDLSLNAYTADGNVEDNVINSIVNVEEKVSSSALLPALLIVLLLLVGVVRIKAFSVVAVNAKVN